MLFSAGHDATDDLPDGFAFGAIDDTDSVTISTLVDGGAVGGGTPHSYAVFDIDSSSTTCALLNNGEIKCWGSNTSGQLGYGDTATRSEPPADTINLGRRATAMSVGGANVCALLDDGSVKCWGFNRYGQLGYGDRVESADAGNLELERYAPPEGSIDLGGRAVAVETSGVYTCAILEDRSVKCWGGNAAGVLGYGLDFGFGPAYSDEARYRLAPSNTPINLGGRAASITLSSNHACALLEDGSVKCWGDNTYGQLGYGDRVGRNAPAADAINLGASAMAISAADDYTCALLEGGSVKCWGRNLSGTLGYGDNRMRNAPTATAINLGGNAVVIATEDLHACALLEDGSVKCWGENLFGTLGYGDAVNRKAPPADAINLGGRAIDISVGGRYSCALLDDATMKCWGTNSKGQLGQGAIPARTNRPPQTPIDMGIWH